MINANDISLQRILNLEQEVEVLKKMIYDLDGKSVRNDSLNGDTLIANTVNGNKIIAKTINGDRITGGIIEGTLLKTTNTENNMTAQAQWIEVYRYGYKLMEIGIVENSSGNPVIHFYHPDGSNYFSIWGSNSDDFVTIGGFGTDVRAFGTWNFDNVLINGNQVATLNDIPAPAP